MNENDGGDGSPGTVALAAAWSALRDAVADEFIALLPASMTFEDVAMLLGMTMGDVEDLRLRNEVTFRRVRGRLEFRPAENRALLRRELLLRLPLPAA